MKNTILALLLVGCASSAPAPPPEIETAAKKTAGEPVAMRCENDGWAGVQCTALFVGNYVPKWTTYVDGEPRYYTHGISVSLPADYRWTLIQMVVTDGRTVITLYVWARRRTPTAPPQFFPYGDETPK